MKKLITNYTFDASEKTVNFNDYTGTFDIKGLLLIVNVTDNIAIYNFAVDGLGYTTVSDDLVTLELASVTSMADGDSLLIYYDDPIATQLVDLGTTDNAVLDVIADKISDIADAYDSSIDVVGTVGVIHSISGVGNGVKTVSHAGTDVALSGGATIKKIDIQAQTDNTGLIAVGASGVDATVSDGTGIILNAGDVYSLEIDNLAKIYIDATVDGEGVRYTYFT